MTFRVVPSPNSAGVFLLNIDRVASMLKLSSMITQIGNFNLSNLTTYLLPLTIVAV